MKVTLAKTSELILDPDNAREHSERNISAIKRSLQRFGMPGKSVTSDRFDITLL